jgi:hypothetical protein
MKKSIILSVLLLSSWINFAQVKTPAASPKATVQQTVGLTEVTLEYNRPSARGRAVFGDLVPFGRMWRTGANQNSMVSFSDDVVINGKTVSKGKYAIFVTPKADNWEVILYDDTNNWGLPEKWDDAKVAVKTNIKPEALNRNIETFTIAINQLDDANFGYLEISWEKTLVSIKFEVPTKELAMSNINKVLAGATFGDYYAAANYYYASNLDLNTALGYMNTAIEMATKARGEAPFWYLRVKSLIQAKNGDKKGAIETAKLSLTGAEKAENNDYIKMNKDSIAEWSRK